MSLYNRIPYINSPYVQTHPSRLFVIGRLAGMQPRPVETCRVLEIGASEGENLVGMAMVLPSAEFNGIELAEVPVTRGRKTIADLGLKNVRLEQKNVLEIDQSFGQFDYIVAHGLYAWTPEDVRDKILAVARANLHPQGIAFISYNAHPGGRIREMFRDMMRHHIGTEEDPLRKLGKARELLRLMAVERIDPDALETAVTAYAVELLEKTDSALFHDDLCDIYRPVYFHEFMAHAARHNLQYLGEANVQDSLPRRLKPEAIAQIREMTAGDKIAEQQYADFARTRRFRQTLLCQAEVEFGEGSAAGCYASSSTQESEDGAFVNLQGTRMSTTHPAPVEYLRRLLGIWPGSEPVAEKDAALALELYKVGMIDLHGFPGVARRGGEKPCVSAFARYQAGRGDMRVTTLGHRMIALTDEQARQLLSIVDGTRDRDTLAAEVGCSREKLDEAMEGLARRELLG